MTASAIIEQIKALSPEDRAKVVGFIHELESAQPPRPRTADDQSFAEAAKWTIDEHTDLMHKPTQSAAQSS